MFKLPANRIENSLWVFTFSICRLHGMCFPLFGLRKHMLSGEGGLLNY